MTDHSQTNTNQTYTLRTILILTVLVAGVAAAHSQDVPSNAPYKNAKLPVEQRVRDLLGRMTVEEKASMLAGANWMESVAIPRLGIPSIKMADGPMGVRAWYGSSAITNSSSPATMVMATSFPAGETMAATWDPDLVEREGVAVSYTHLTLPTN